MSTGLVVTGQLIYIPTQLQPETRLAESTARSIPLAHLARFWIDAGINAYSSTNEANNGMRNVPPLPCSTAFTIRFATSSGCTTGAKKLLGDLTCWNNAVVNCPGSTSNVFTGPLVTPTAASAPALALAFAPTPIAVALALESRNSAARVLCAADTAAFVAE